GATTLLEGGMAEAVIGRTLLRILEKFVGFVDFLELLLGRGVARILVGVPFHRELAEGALELLFVRGLAHAERFIEIRFRHFSLTEREIRENFEFCASPSATGLLPDN